MKNELVTFSTAKLAKDAGFDEPCENGFNNAGKEFYNSLRFRNSKLNSTLFGRPTQSLLARWLREKHGIHVEPGKYQKDSYCCLVFFYPENVDMPSYIFDEDDGFFATYELALEAGLEKALTYLKTKI